MLMFYEHIFFKEHNLEKIIFQISTILSTHFPHLKNGLLSKTVRLHKCFPHEFSTEALWKTLFFEYVDFTGFQHFKIIFPQKLSTGFVDYSQLIHTRLFSEKITFSKTPFRFAYCIFLQTTIRFYNYSIRYC